MTKVRTQIKDIYGDGANGGDGAPKESSPILCPNCNAPAVKPSTVLYGNSINENFAVHKGRDLASADLVVIAGENTPVRSNVFIAKFCIVLSRLTCGKRLASE